MEAALSGLLWELSATVRELLRAKSPENSPQRIQRLYIQTRVSGLIYSNTGLNYTTSFEYVPVEEWYLPTQYQFVQTTFKVLPEFQRCMEAIHSIYKVELAATEFQLFQYLQTLLNTDVTQLSDSFIVQQVTTFLQDLDGSPTDWWVKIWIDAIWLEEDEYQLAEGLRLRRPTVSDLETRLPLDTAHFLGLSRPRPTTAIAEITVRERAPLEAQVEVERLLDLLRLFKLGSVYYTHYELRGRSILRFGGKMSQSQPLPYVAIYRYGFTKEDHGRWGTFSTKVRSILFAPSPANIAEITTDAFTAPLQRYKAAVLDLAAVENRITSAITCLESLLLKPKERSELSHRLGQRVATLLKLAGLNPLKTYGDVHEAYEIRSDFIHGGIVNLAKQTEHMVLCERICNYARIVLVSMIELSPTPGKDSLIKMLDNVLLDMSERSRLEEVCKGASLLQNG